MTCHWLLRTIVVSGIALGAIAPQRPGHAAPPKFFCGTSQDQPATLVQSDQGVVSLIRWSDPAFPARWLAQDRCEEISQKFQQVYDNGTLKYLTTSWTGNPALCLALYKGEGCLPNGILATFKPGTSANLTMLRLLNLDVLGGQQPFSQMLGTGRSTLISEMNDSVYVDIAGFLSRLEQKAPGQTQRPHPPEHSPGQPAH